MLNYLLGIQIFGSILGFLVFYRSFSLFKFFSFFLSLINLWFSFLFLLLFNQNINDFQFRSFFILADIPFSFSFDGISITLFFLTSFIFPILFLIDDFYDSISYLFCLLFLLFILSVIFVTNDLGFFFIFFEISLIPLVFFIALFGGSPFEEKRLEASYRIFLFTLLGSFSLLIGILFLQSLLYSTQFDLLFFSLSFSSSLPFFIIFFLFLFSFFIKIPVYPLHSWLPFAHSEASTRGSVLLAAIILKIATYGLFRFLLFFFPFFSQFFSPIILIFGFLSLLYGSISTLRQIDLKSIIAYSSIVHMSFSLMGQFSSSFFGLFGAFYTMFSHAFISSGLFILIGCLYNRYHSRILDYFRGLFLPMPLFSSFFLLFSFANMSIPLSAAFIGEFYLLKGILDFNLYFSFFLAFALFFSTLFMLFFTNRLLFGSLTPFLSSFNDFNLREFFSLLPLLFFSLFFGLNSNPLLFFGLNPLLLLLPL